MKWFKQRIWHDVPDSGRWVTVDSARGMVLERWVVQQICFSTGEVRLIPNGFLPDRVGFE